MNVYVLSFHKAFCQCSDESLKGCYGSVKTECVAEGADSDAAMRAVIFPDKQYPAPLFFQEADDLQRRNIFEDVFIRTVIDADDHDKIVFRDAGDHLRTAYQPVTCHIFCPSVIFPECTHQICKYAAAGTVSDDP